MSNYNKTIAAGLAGNIVTVVLALMQQFWPDMYKALSAPAVQAALQTLFTAGAVYLSPPNNAQ